MPEISRFFGIRITLNWGDHAPPHFHATHGLDTAMVSIANGQILQGHLGKTAQRLVNEWASQYREELFADWERAANKLPLEKIPPLE